MLGLSPTNCRVDGVVETDEVTDGASGATVELTPAGKTDPRYVFQPAYVPSLLIVEISTSRPVEGVAPEDKLKLSLAEVPPTLLTARPLAEPTVGTAAELVDTALDV